MGQGWSGVSPLGWGWGGFSAGWWVRHRRAVAHHAKVVSERGAAEEAQQPPHWHDDQPRLITRANPFHQNVAFKNAPRYFTSWWGDWYHITLNQPWWVLWAHFILFYLIFNFIFAAFYYADHTGVNDGTLNPDLRYADCFFFSVQTWASLGYGRLNPQSDYISIVSCIEIYMSWLYLWMSAGILWTKVARPSRQKRQILWSDVAVVNNYEWYWAGPISEVDKGHYERGRVPCLVFRFANVRHTQQIIDPNFRLLLIRKEYAQQCTVDDVYGKKQIDKASSIGGHEGGSPDGLRVVRRVHELNFELNTQIGRIRTNMMSVPLLSLPWTVIHPMDKDSPLHGATPESLAASQAEIVGVFDGYYEMTGNGFQARWSYTHKDIVWNARFVDCLKTRRKSSPIKKAYVVDCGKLGQYRLVESFVPGNERDKRDENGL